MKSKCDKNKIKKKNIKDAKLQFVKLTAECSVTICRFAVGAKAKLLKTSE